MQEKILCSTKRTKTDEDIPEIRILSEEEYREMKESLARKKFDMSLEEFTEAWKAGKFDGDRERHGDVIRLADDVAGVLDRLTTGRTPPLAVNNYQSAVQRVVSCVSDSVVSVAGGYYPSPVPHSLIVDSGLLRGESRLRLRLEQYYRIVEQDPPSNEWRVVVVGYDYAVYDSDEREVLLYHWHPGGSSSVAAPYLHLGAGAQVGHRDVREAHLPTGHIPLQGLLRVLIEEMGVQPRRADWDGTLRWGWCLTARKFGFKCAKGFVFSCVS